MGTVALAPDASAARVPAAALGVDFFTGTVAEAAEAIVARARSGAGGYCCFASAHLIICATHDAAVRRALDGAWTTFPDGAPVAWLLRRAHELESGRTPGPDVMPQVLRRGRAAGLRHFLYGSSPEVVARLRTRIHADLPGTAIVGAYAPPFDAGSRAEDPRVLRAIAAARPHVVWCALGAPKQELWMRRHAAALAPAVLAGVGAAFDFLAGTTPRPPRWMRQHGLEWLGRLALEPSRLGRRYLLTNPEFLLLAAFDLAHRRRPV